MDLNRKRIAMRQGDHSDIAACLRPLDIWANVSEFIMTRQLTNFSIIVQMGYEEILGVF